MQSLWKPTPSRLGAAATEGTSGSGISDGLRLIACTPGTRAITLLAWTWLTIWPLGAKQTATHATREDPSRAMSDVLLLAAAVAILAAVVGKVAMCWRGISTKSLRSRHRAGPRSSSLPPTPLPPLQQPAGANESGLVLVHHVLSNPSTARRLAEPPYQARLVGPSRM